MFYESCRSHVQQLTKFYGEALAARTSGLFNSGGQGISGLQNVGTLESGWANLGNFMSGFYNTTMLNLATQAFVSCFANFGTQLSGVLNGVTLP